MKAKMPNPVRRLLHRERITQAQLARAIGVSRAAVSLWVSGACVPSFRSAGRLAREYGGRPHEYRQMWSPELTEAELEAIARKCAEIAEAKAEAKAKGRET